MEITKTVLSLMLVVITILTSLTTTIAAVYAEGDNDGGDGNKNKAEDESAAAIADCDENDVEQAGFDCIAIAASEIETAEEEPPEESITLFICKEVEDPNQELIPFDFGITVRPISGGGSVTFPGGPPGDPDPDCQDGSPPAGLVPGVYEVIDTPDGGIPPPDRVEVEGDCTQDPTNQQRATVEIQEGDTLTCTFTNIYEDDDS